MIIIISLLLLEHSLPSQQRRPRHSFQIDICVMALKVSSYQPNPYSSHSSVQ